MDDLNSQHEINKYRKFKKVDGAAYRKVNTFLRKRTYITAREWALARLCTDFRTSGGAEMTFIGQHLPELVPFMEDTYSPQAVNQARNAFKKKVRKSSATFFYGAMCGFFTTDELDDLLFEAGEVARFLLEVEGTTLDIDEEIDIEDRITKVMRGVGVAAKILLQNRDLERSGKDQAAGPDPVATGSVNSNGPEKPAESPPAARRIRKGPVPAGIPPSVHLESSAGPASYSPIPEKTELKGKNSLPPVPRASQISGGAEPAVGNPGEMEIPDEPEPPVEDSRFLKTPIIQRTRETELTKDDPGETQVPDNHNLTSKGSLASDTNEIRLTGTPDHQGNDIKEDPERTATDPDPGPEKEDS